MKLCAALPATTQQCLVPGYQSHHAAGMRRRELTDEKSRELFSCAGDLEPPKESGQSRLAATIVQRLNNRSFSR